MNITQITNNSFRISDIFPSDVCEEVLTLSKTFTPTDVRIGHGATDLDSKREVYAISGDLYPRYYGYFLEIINHITPIGENMPVIAFELWNDYPGYYNPWHKDGALVKNIMIIYLDSLDPKMGTQFLENGEIHSVAYKKNTGFVLLNSDKIEHGMIAAVPRDIIRRTLYLTWKFEQ